MARTFYTIVSWIVALGLTLDLASAGTPLGSGFTYQGQLKQDGSPYTGSADVRFTLWDAGSAGTTVGTACTVYAVEVRNGLFSCQVDFGAAAFGGERRWLEIAVRAPAGVGEFTALAARQEITPTPYALYAPGGSPWQIIGSDLAYTAGHVAVGGPPSANHALYVQGGNGGIYGIATAGSQLNRPFGVTAGLATNAVANTGGGFRTHLVSSETLNIGVLLGGQFTIDDDVGIKVRALNLGLVNADADDYALELAADAPAYAIYSVGTGQVFINGRVGIGIHEPTEALQVDGIIQSLAGGIRFPDGTTQTTAATTSGGNTLDQAYDEGGAGAGRTITADAGAVTIAGPHGLTVNGPLAVGTVTPAATFTVQGGDLAVSAVAKAGTGAVRPFAYVADLNTSAVVNTGGGFRATLESGKAPHVDVIYGGLFQVNDDANRMARALTLTTQNEESDDYGLEIITTSPGYAIHASGSGLVYLAGNVGIGESSPSQKLHVAGNICATGTIGACSDGRLKQNLRPIRDARGLVGRLRGVRFTWRPEASAERGFSQHTQVGFIAQEVEAVLPEVVTHGRDDLCSLDYGRLVPVLVEAIKELDSQLQAQQKEIQAQHARLAQLEQRLAELDRDRGGPHP